MFISTFKGFSKNIYDSSENQETISPISITKEKSESPVNRRREYTNTLNNKEKTNKQQSSYLDSLPISDRRLLKTPPPYLIILPLNGVLMKRISGGENNQFKQSNKNINERPGATKLVQYLVNSKMYEVVFYSYMKMQNHKISLKTIVKGPQTNISIDNLVHFYDNFTKNGNNFLNHKGTIISWVNKKLGTNYNTKNSLFIDFSIENVYTVLSSSLLIPKYNGNMDDDVLYKLLNIFIDIEKAKKINHLGQYVGITYPELSQIANTATIE